MSEIISVENLKKSFGTLDVIKGISFSVEKGEVLGIIGPSGSGKSTILRCISQLEDVTGGTIKICGETLVENGVYVDKAKRHEITLKSGLVFQNFNLFPHYSVLQIVTEPQIRVLKKSKEEAVAVAMELLQRFIEAELSLFQRDSTKLLKFWAILQDRLFSESFCRRL